MKKKKLSAEDYEKREKFLLKNTAVGTDEAHILKKDLEVRQQAFLKGEYSISYFNGLTAAYAEELIKKGWMDAKDTQNDSPTNREMVDFCASNPSFTMHGYVLPPGRPDTRISLEGVGVKDGARPGREEVENFAEMFRHADEFDMGPCYRAWYD